MGTDGALIGQVACDAVATSWVSGALQEALKRQEKSNLSVEVRARIAEARKVWDRLLFPSPKLEAWKYTNPEAIAKGPFTLASGRDLVAAKQILESRVLTGLGESLRIVYVDGQFSPELSWSDSAKLEKGLQVTRLNDSQATNPASLTPASLTPASMTVGALGLHNEDAFAALATALLSDAVCISVAAGCVVRAPIHVVHIVTSAADRAVLAPRVVIEAGESSQVVVVESHTGVEGACYLSLPITEIRADSNAQVDYYKIQVESTEAFHVSGLVAQAHRDAHVRNHIFSFGGALVRNNAQMLLRGAQSQAVLNGLSLLNAEQHVDNTTLIHHIEPSAESREHFKGIYSGKSRGVFSGTITVDKIAQKTNAFQSNQALLLSSDASIESRPQLKIWADDVKCTHGATVGQLDKDALFYLRSRGLSLEAAKGFLVHAFASEVLTSVQVNSVRDYVEQLISARLDS